jgi:hypothetical protein
VQHWLAAVGLAAHMAEGHRAASSDAGGGWYGFWNGNPKRGLVCLFGISAVLAPLFGLTVHLGRYGGVQGAGWDADLAGFLQANPAALKALFGVSTATAFVHFVLDRAVFRLSDGEVRKVTGRLLFRSDTLGAGASVHGTMAPAAPRK